VRVKSVLVSEGSINSASCCPAGLVGTHLILKYQQ